MTVRSFSQHCRAASMLGILCALGALTPLLNGCGSGDRTVPVTAEATPTPTPSPTPDGPVTVTSRYQDLIYTLTIPKRIYAHGEVVPLTFTVQNVGTTDVSFQDAAPDYCGGEVRRLDGSIVNEFADRTTYSATAGTKSATRLTVIYAHDFPAGQTKTFTLKWNQIDTHTDLGSTIQASAGDYNIRASLYTNNLNINGTVVQPLGTDQLGPGPITITVQ